MMSETTQAAQVPPIQYPTITIPGKGTYIVKFGFGAVYTLEEQLGMSTEQIGQKLGDLFPPLGPDGTRPPAIVSPAFLTKVLAACIWDQAHMTPQEVAYSFDVADLPTIGRAVAEAFAKMRWPARPPLQEPVTKAEAVQ
jgi:hypothetical protein